MASTSSINSNSSGSQAPNPPPRTHSTHSRPTQPPPPPPLPSVPPVPPTRDSSINIARTIVSQTISPAGSRITTSNESGFLSDLVKLFKPIQDLPPPEPCMNKHKSYPSQKSHHKQSIAPKLDTVACKSGQIN